MKLESNPVVIDVFNKKDLFLYENIATATAEDGREIKIQSIPHNRTLVFTTSKGRYAISIKSLIEAAMPSIEKAEEVNHANP